MHSPKNQYSSDFLLKWSAGSSSSPIPQEFTSSTSAVAATNVSSKEALVQQLKSDLSESKQDFYLTAAQVRLLLDLPAAEEAKEPQELLEVPPVPQAPRAPQKVKCAKLPDLVESPCNSSILEEDEETVDTSLDGGSNAFFGGDWNMVISDELDDMSPDEIQAIMLGLTAAEETANGRDSFASRGSISAVVQRLSGSSNGTDTDYLVTFEGSWSSHSEVAVDLDLDSLSKKQQQDQEPSVSNDKTELVPEVSIPSIFDSSQLFDIGNYKPGVVLRNSIPPIFESSLLANEPTKEAVVLMDLDWDSPSKKQQQEQELSVSNDKSGVVCRQYSITLDESDFDFGEMVNREEQNFETSILQTHGLQDKYPTEADSKTTRPQPLNAQHRQASVQQIPPTKDKSAKGISFVVSLPGIIGQKSICRSQKPKPVSRQVTLERQPAKQTQGHAQQEAAHFRINGKGLRFQVKRLMKNINEKEHPLKAS